MERTLIADLPGRVGERVRLAGWLHNRRDLSRVAFLVLRDRTGLAQVVLEPGTAAVTLESVLEVDGVVTASAQAPAGVELHGASVRVLSRADGPAPVELHRPEPREALPTLLDHASVALRHPRRRAAHAVAAASVAGFRATLDALGFTEVHTPKLVGAATESGASLFRVDYFGRDAFLAQSPQLYKQVLVGAFERVFETGPVFRAEPHDTARHLAEYLSLDAELGFVRDHRDVMAVAREAVAGMAVAARERTGLDVPDVPAEIPWLDFPEALRIAGADPDELDLAPADERAVGAWARREHGSDFAFVVGYPLAKRPFYTHPDPQRPNLSRGFDLIFRGLEVITGGQRLHRHEEYLEALAERGQDSAPYAWYLEAFRHGLPPHGGFALGLERWTMQLTGAGNVRETTLFPRDRSRLAP